MITTVKNTRGYNIFISGLFISVLCTCAIGYLGYTSKIKSAWFVGIGFGASFTACLHQIYLITKAKAFTRLHGLNTFVIFGYLCALFSSIVVPTLFTGQFNALTEENKSIARYLFITYAVNFVPIYILFLSVFYKNSQKCQSYLHPFTEIIDGFVKSSGSIQMTNIPAESTLKQVVIGDGKVGDEEGGDKENILLPSHKADGSSPKPSKVLKTWPKPDPFPVRALYSFKPTSVSELPFKKGDTITVLDCRGRWWQAQKDDRVGFIPSNYVAVLQKARVISTFTASDDDQVSVKKDEVIEVMESYDEKCLVRNVEDKIGAVPTGKLELLHED